MPGTTSKQRVPSEQLTDRKERMAGPRPRIPRFPGRSNRDHPKNTREDAVPGGSRDLPTPVVTEPTPAHTFNGRLIALVVVATIILFLAAPTAKIYMDQRSQIAQLQRTIAEEERHQDELKKQERLWNDDSYVEQQARERMFYVRPGESAYVVVGAQDVSGETVTSSAEQVEAGRPAWADGLWNSVVDSAFPQQDVSISIEQPDESRNQ